MFGCGPASVCDRLPSVQNQVVSKRGTCTVNLTLGGKSACDAAIEGGQCSSSDETAIGRVYDCSSRLPSCTPGGEVSWLSQFNACGVGTGISSACRF
jgi:hypothetical protein